MSKRIFRAIFLVALAVLIACLSLVMGVLYEYFSQLQERQLRTQLDLVAQGVALGTSAHVIGTAKANEIGELTGAASSLSLVVAGLLTAVAMPLLAQLL